MFQPMIIKETSEGLFRCEIQDEMLTHREIEIVGDINAESVYSIIRQLRYLERVDADAEITMFINSPGGEVSSGLALYDVMKAISCPIRTVCVGTAASMGAVLFTAGDKRELLSHARIMIHDPLISGGIGGSALQVHSISEHLLRTRETVAKILAEHTGKTIEEIYNKTAKDTYFYGEEAVEFGLADRVVDKI